MGLEGVELVMEMEETFGIVIDDLDAEQIGTVGQAYRYILRKLELSRDIPCPSASLFYKLRRALTARYEADRQSISPSARIADLLPEQGRRQAWIDLRDEVGMTMPRLEFGAGIRLAVWLLGLGPVLGLTLIFWSNGLLSAREAALAAFLFGTITLVEAHLVLDPFAKQIPRSCATVRGTIETILGQHRMTHDGRPRHDEDVWFTLRGLISEQCGVPQDQVTEEKSFVDDFGMD